MITDLSSAHLVLSRARKRDKKSSYKCPHTCGTFIRDQYDPTPNMETDYMGRCPKCGIKDHFLKNINQIKCKHCGIVVGKQFSENIDVTILPSWNDIKRWKKTASKNEN